jgi:hypothetical protein
MDDLCEWERNSGRQSTLILIPHNSDEKIIVAMDGKPLPDDSSVSINQAISLALHDRAPKSDECAHTNIEAKKE